MPDERVFATETPQSYEGVFFSKTTVARKRPPHIAKVGRS